MESDSRYYRRRAVEELAAADRAVTPAARERRLQLADLYLKKLREMDEPSAVGERDLSLRLAGQKAAVSWGASRESQFA